MIVSFCPFSYLDLGPSILGPSLDPRCMVGRMYGTTSCGSWFQRRFFKVFPHFKSIEAYDSMASINTRSMDGRIYVGDHKVRKRAKIRNRYNQAPHLTQDTYGKVTTSQLDITNKEPRGQPFPSR